MMELQEYNLSMNRNDLFDRFRRARRLEGWAPLAGEADGSKLPDFIVFSGHPWMRYPAGTPGAAFTVFDASQRDLLPYGAVATTSPFVRGRQAMAHNYAINDDVHHQLQGPQGRAVVKQRSVYTVVSCLPIEADGRPRYRIKSKTENIERVVTEEQISRLG
jgi:hypothetical protein